MTASSFLVALQLQDRRCVVLGGSEEAALRARNLARAGARVRVIAAEPCAALLRQSEIELERRAYEATDLDGAFLVVLADRDAELLSHVGPDCQARGIPFCAVDQPGYNSFHHVGVARAGPLSVGVSTDGTAPALGRRLRAELERSFAEAQLGDFARHVAELRAKTPAQDRRERLGREVERLRLIGGWTFDDDLDDR